MLQCKAPEPLPADLEAILNSNPEHGVLYVSFGTCLHANTMSEKVRKVRFLIKKLNSSS